MALDESEQMTAGTDPRRLRPLRTTPDEVHEVASSNEHDPAETMIVDAARAGDGDAFRTLVERYQDHVFRLAMRVLRCDRDTAQDLCQEVFMRAFRGLPRFDGGVRFPVWLHTIALNTVITEYRARRTIKRGRHRALSIDAPIAGTDDLYIQPPSRELDPSDSADQKEFGAAVRDAVTQLPDEFREAVVLRDMQGLAYEEIAELLDVPPGTVRSRIHRGRLILQGLLKGFRS
ncbi:MAG: sigma-70 family RNA polymerase sigma factor [Planctomycetes bacterium]|nr:sigma-70 family RNA polymerase sigma factor [Planctomycetota bacterium]